MIPTDHAAKYELVPQSRHDGPSQRNKLRGHFNTQTAVDRPEVAIVQNNSNRPEPPVTGGQPPVEF